MEHLLSSLETLIVTVFESGLVIVLAALLIGFIIKRWIPNTALQSKWIPTINLVLGGLLGVLIPNCFPDVGAVTQVVYGAMCGVSASFVYDKIISLFLSKQEEQ